jgi:carbon monoxide dehydrogenase subunit G
VQLTHSFTVPAPVQQTWDTFMDLELVGGCFPGATVTAVTDEGFSGTVKVKLGPIALVYTGSGRFVERDDESHRAVIEAKGKDKRGNGTAGANVSIQLSPDGSGTRADVSTDLAVTGKPAQFGRGVMQDVSDKLLGQFIACIEGKLGPGEGAPAAEPGAPTAEPGAPTAEPGAPADVTAVPTATAAGPEVPATTSTAVPAPEPAAPEPAAPEPAAAKPAVPSASPPGAHRDEDNALSALSLVGVVLKGLWRRVLAALRRRKRGG